jgi:hypothetical protein
MKKTNLSFWIVTGLFCAFMLFSSIPGLLLTEQSKTFMHHLQYPDYFTFFLSLAKVLGVIAILLPGYPIIKEWAYAGLLFDLIGATYSQIAVDGFQPSVAFMVIPILFWATSYFLFHKRVQQKVAQSSFA